MPQMAPLSWFILFVVFSATLILFNLMNYFIFTNTSPVTSGSQSSISSAPLNWKW